MALVSCQFNIPTETDATKLLFEDVNDIGDGSLAVRVQTSALSVCVHFKKRFDMVTAVVLHGIHHVIKALKRHYPELKG